MHHLLLCPCSHSWTRSTKRAASTDAHPGIRSRTCSPPRSPCVGSLLFPLRVFLARRQSFTRRFCCLDHCSGRLLRHLGPWSRSPIPTHEYDLHEDGLQDTST